MAATESILCCSTFVNRAQHVYILAHMERLCNTFWRKTYTNAEYFRNLGSTTKPFQPKTSKRLAFLRSYSRKSPSPFRFGKSLLRKMQHNMDSVAQDGGIFLCLELSNFYLF